MNDQCIQILPEIGGWKKVIDTFFRIHIARMKRYPESRVVLLIDFDERENRFEYAKQQIPDDLENRVFVLGTFSEPEVLKRETKKNFEDIGETLAQECCENTSELWNHILLKHNEDERKRMVDTVTPILFN